MRTEGFRNVKNPPWLSQLLSIPQSAVDFFVPIVNY